MIDQTNQSIKYSSFKLCNIAPETLESIKQIVS